MTFNRPGGFGVNLGLSIPGTAILQNSSSIPSWVLIAGGIAPSVDIDLLNNRAWVNGTGTVLPSTLLSVSRASQETYTDSSGNLSYIANNTLALGSAGLQVWEGRTNLLLQSQNYGTTWGQSGSIVITSGATTAPDGNSTGTLISDNSTASANYGVNQTVTVVNGSTYTSYAILKQKDYQFVQFNVVASGNHLSYFDLQNGVVAGTPSGTVGQGVVSLANGWKLCWITYVTTATTATTNIFYTNSSSSSSHTGVVGTGTYFWGSQIELGAFASPYIPTTTTSAARAADSITATGVLATALSAPVGSVFAKLTSRPAFTGAPRIISQTGAMSNKALLYVSTATSVGIYNAATLLGAIAGSGGGGTSGFFASPANVASGFSPGATSIVFNNSTVGTDTNSYQLSTTPTIGGDTGVDPYYDGNFLRLTSWLSKLPDATLKALTQ